MNERSTSAGAAVDAPMWHRLAVGLDGSQSAISAMEWAAGEAAIRGASLRVVACQEGSGVDHQGIGVRQRQNLDDVVGAARRRRPQLSIEEATTVLGPQDALLEVASSADLLIVGASTFGAAERWLLGSIPRTAARRSSCPVIVVRAQPQQSRRRIVVGVDSSNAAAAALDWAVDEADCHDAELIVVHAWQPRTEVVRSMRARDLARSDAQCVVDLAVRHCKKRSNRAVRGELIEGEATSVLTMASEDADLMAVGSRGPSGFKTMLFGTVALFAVEHASCPVAVIHPRSRASVLMPGSGRDVA